MNGRAWAVMAGANAVLFGGLLLGCGNWRSWANFPAAAGAYLAMDGIVILLCAPFGRWKR